MLGGLAIASAAGLFLADAPRAFGIRLLFDGYDLSVYYNSSRWIIEGGRLYREVPSEYPLLANIIFAAYRYLSNLVAPGFHGFVVVWIASACFIFYIFLIYWIAPGGAITVLAWLAPAPIYFALYRYDLYPALATFSALIAIRRNAYIQGALWLGIAAALKGYALFLFPAYCIFIVYQRGFITALIVSAVLVAPMTLSLLVTFGFAGWEGVVAPFKFHLERATNGHSTYDAMNYLFRSPVTLGLKNALWITYLLQIGAAVAAAAARPRHFENLINSFLFALFGFMSFSVFYSPQFLLWVLPLLYFSTSRVMLITTILLSWLTYLYFPVIYDFDDGDANMRSLKIAVITITLLRLMMMFVAGKLMLKPREKIGRQLHSI